MAVATKSKPAAATAERAPSTDDVSVGARAERIMRDQTELFEEAERLLTLRAAGTPDPRDGVVYSVLNWDPSRIKREVERATRVTVFKRRAGTAADRAQAEEEATAALADEQIGNARDLALVQEAQARIRERSDRARSAERVVFGHTEALRVLRDERLLPEHVQMRRRMDRSACDHCDRRRLVEARGRVRSIDAVLALRPEDHLPSIRLHCGGNADCGEALHAWGKLPEGRTGFPPPAEWEAYRAKLSAEREPLVELIAELAPGDAARQAAVDKLLDYHVDKLG